MIPVSVKTLVMFAPPAPSALILEPMDESDEFYSKTEQVRQPGTYRIVPIWIAAPDAFNIGRALDGDVPERPGTHDLFTNALATLDACIERVVIDGIQGRLFSSKLILSQYGRQIELDARPSDAIALALRQDAPIFMEESVLAEGSYPYIIRDTSTQEEDLETFRSFLENVVPDDFK